MIIEFIGSTVPAWPRREDPDYPIRAAALDEDAGFDKLLVGYGASAPAGLIVANEMLTATSRIGMLITHVPGLVAPALAARQFATLAAFHHGRVSLHASTEPGAAGPRDGDACEPALWPRRAAEFLDIVRLSWHSPEPFDYCGEFYQVAGSGAAVSSAGRGVPIYLSAESADAVRAGAGQADVFVFAGAPTAVIAGQLASARAATSACNRSPSFGVSLRLITAPTERAARDRYRRSRRGQQAGENRAADRRPGTGTISTPWIPPPVIGAAGVPAIVGSYGQVAAALLDYVAVGVSTFVLGHDPLADAADCAAVIALVREQADTGRHLVA